MATSIPTVDSIRRINRRLDRRRLSVGRVLAAMREGQALHLGFEREQSVWWLTSSLRVSSDVVESVIIHAQVVSVGNGLFRNARAQTYRWSEN